jgi:dihydrolipoamide dehydrogenase
MTNPASAMPPESCDLLVLGGGAAGCAAALRAAELGMGVVLVEERAAGLGGAHLHETRIPMAILGHACATAEALESTGYLGDLPDAPCVSFEGVARHARKVISSLNASAREVLEGAGVAVCTGRGFLAAEQLVAVLDPATGDEAGMVRASAVLLATGTVPVTPPWFLHDSALCLWPHELLSLPHLPESCIVAGADAAACETARFASMLGCHVTLIAGPDGFLHGVDAEVREHVLGQLGADGVRLVVGDGTAVVETDPDGSREEVRVVLEGKSSVTANVLVVSPRRRPRVAPLGVRKLGIGVSEETGGVVVNKHLRTAAGTVYAAGECVLAETPVEIARDQGAYVAEHAAGCAGARQAPMPRQLHTLTVLSFAASAGIGEDAARALSGDVAVGACHLSENASAVIAGLTPGFVKIVADAATGEILGAHATGHMAAEVIAAASLAMQFEYTVSDLADMMVASPSIMRSLVTAARAAAAGVRR